jgi:hypothetical protein
MNNLTNKENTLFQEINSFSEKYGLNILVKKIDITTPSIYQTNKYITKLDPKNELWTGHKTINSLQRWFANLHESYKTVTPGKRRFLPTCLKCLIILSNNKTHIPFEYISETGEISNCVKCGDEVTDKRLRRYYTITETIMDSDTCKNYILQP